MRLLFFAVLIFISANSFAQKAEYLSLLIPDDLTKNADAVVRLDEMVIDILAQDNMIIKSKRVITVLNKNGDKHIHAREGYSGSYKIKSISAIICDPTGREVKKIKEKDFIDVSAVSGGTLYSDSRVKFLRYTPIQYPYTVIFESEVHSKNTGAMPSWYFIDGYGLGVEKSKYEIKFPNQNLKPVIQERNTKGFNILKEENGNAITFIGKNINPIKYENMSPSFKEISPRLMVAMKKFYYEGYRADASDWKEIGKWMHDNLLKERSNLSEATKMKMRALVKEARNDIEKAKLVYKYVQENTRYISVQEGIGGIQPISAAEVDRLKYGDCKGLTNYTKSLLEAVDVQAYYTRVYAERNYKANIDKEFPSFVGQTNHVILNIPRENEEDIWLECTSQIMPFGFLGDFTDDRNVFVLKPEGGEIIKTPSYKEDRNYQKIVGDIVLTEDGMLSASASIVTKGIQYDNRFYIEDYDKEEVLKHYQKQWSTINNLVLEDYKFSNDKSKVEFVEDVSISAENFSKPSGGRILFRVNILNRNNNVPKRYRSRKLPFKISRGFLDVDSYNITIPEGYKVEFLPAKKEIASEFGEYTAEVVAQEDGSLQYEHRFLLKSGSYTKEKYSEYRSFRREVAKSDNTQIVLVKK